MVNVGGLIFYVMVNMAVWVEGKTHSMRNTWPVLIIIIHSSSIAALFSLLLQFLSGDQPGRCSGDKPCTLSPL